MFENGDAVMQLRASSSDDPVIVADRKFVHGLTSKQQRIKRTVDIIGALVGLLASCWALVLIACAIKLTSRGPILFRQERRGLHNTRFRCLKFRTMREESADAHASRQTSKNDDRVTKVGAILRRHSLDELPQLWNVLVGDMSLIGPRPHALGTSIGNQLLDQIDGRYLNRYVVKPGITGLAQVQGCRGNLASHEKFERRLYWDFQYIENWSLRLDAKIALKTIVCLFRDGDAY